MCAADPTSGEAKTPEATQGDATGVAAALLASYSEIKEKLTALGINSDLIGKGKRSTRNSRRKEGSWKSRKAKEGSKGANPSLKPSKPKPLTHAPEWLPNNGISSGGMSLIKLLVKDKKIWESLSKQLQR